MSPPSVTSGFRTSSGLAIAGSPQLSAESSSSSYQPNRADMSGAATTQQHPYARQPFFESKRFGEILVRAQVEPHDLAATVTRAVSKRIGTLIRWLDGLSLMKAMRQQDFLARMHINMPGCLRFDASFE